MPGISNDYCGQTQPHEPHQWTSYSKLGSFMAFTHQCAGVVKLAAVSEVHYGTDPSMKPENFVKDIEIASSPFRNHNLTPRERLEYLVGPVDDLAWEQIEDIFDDSDDFAYYLVTVDGKEVRLGRADVKIVKKQEFV